MKKGQTISQTELTKDFNKVLLKLNALTSSNIKVLSSGQICTFGRWQEQRENIIPVVTEILDVGTEQYFDDMNAPVISSVVDYSFISDGFVEDLPSISKNYLQKLLDDVKIITD